MSQEPKAAQLFELVWNTLIDVLGTATTATLFRKAAKNVAAMRPELEGLHGFAVARDGLEFRYVLPTSWQRENPAGIEELRYLVRDALCPLLKELTGAVVIDLLERKPDLQRYGMIEIQGE